MRLVAPTRSQPLNRPFGSQAVTAESIAFSPDGKTLASEGRDGRLWLWNVGTRGKVWVTPAHALSGDEPQIAFSPVGGMIATSSHSTQGGELRFWNAGSGQQLGDAISAGVDVAGLAFSADGHTLVSGDSDGVVRLWDVRRRRLRGKPLTIDRPAFWALALSPDGKTLATGGQYSLQLWNLHKRRQLGKTVNDSDGVSALGFSPDGRTLAWYDGTLRLWDVNRQREVGRSLAVGDVSSVAFSPDGKTLVLGGQDGLQFWDLEHRRRLGEPQALRDVSSVGFSPDGKRLVSGGDRVRLWDPVLWTTRTDVFAAHTCPVLGRSLTGDEWAFYLPGIRYRKTCER